MYFQFLQNPGKLSRDHHVHLLYDTDTDTDTRQLSPPLSSYCSVHYALLSSHFQLTHSTARKDETIDL